MDEIMIDDRHILYINNNRYMFFLCCKYNNEYCIISQNRNMIVQEDNDYINFSFLSDKYFNIYLQDVKFYLYAFLVDREINNNIKHLQFIDEKSSNLKSIFQSYGFVDNYNEYKIIKYFELNKNYIINKLNTDNKKINISDDIYFYFSKYEDNILCCLPSINIKKNDIRVLLK